LNPLVVIVGPTGSGKSDLALHVAAKLQGEVVNCDSIQLYRHLDIGSAKLPVEERRGIPHHLIDVLDPDEIFTAGEYSRRARAILRETTARGRLPVVAGGTGFYLRALLEGLVHGPTREQELRDRLAARERRRSGSLHRLLRRFDPESARRVHANDVPKVIRALEVRLLTRRPMSRLFEEGRDALIGYRVTKVGLFPEREALYKRLEERTRRMFDSGLIDEVRDILARGFPADSKALESLGYRQAVQVLHGELSRKEAIFYAIRDTRRYAKRQMTWFRSERDLRIYKGFGNDAEIQDAVLTALQVWLRI
jgi:tRNA dimethylallyltransferase